MFTAFLLLVFIAAIIVVSRRWPDVEERLWPDQAKSRPAAAHQTASEEVPAAPVKVTSTAGGLMKKKPLTDEPDVAPGALDSSAVPAEAPVKPPPAEPATAKKEPVAKKEPEETAVHGPGGHVTGSPARPSEPAYIDATQGGHEDLDALAAEADQAYRDRDYDRAEAACLKILMKQPKNHKYMTRIGQIYQEMGQLEDAKEAFEAAKKLDPKNFFVLNRLAEVNRLISDKGGRTKSKAKSKK